MVLSAARKMDPLEVWRIAADEAVMVMGVVGDAQARPLVEALEAEGVEYALGQACGVVGERARRPVDRSRVSPTGPIDGDAKGMEAMVESSLVIHVHGLSNCVPAIPQSHSLSLSEVGVFLLQARLTKRLTSNTWPRRSM